MKTLLRLFWQHKMGRSFQIAVSVMIILVALTCTSRGRKLPVDACGFELDITLVHRFPEGRPVYGVQPIDDEVFVLRDSATYIEVYDRHTWENKRNVSIAEHLQGPYDMVRSKHGSGSASLFIASWFNAVNLTKIRQGVSEPIFEMWSFLEPELTTLGLARSNVYTGPNIVVTASMSQKVKEFTPDGSLVSEVIVHSISSPRQSIKVASDRYAVCHGYGPPPELHRVCLVDGNGEIIKCYGGVGGSGDGQLDIPARLELNKKNCILVADTGNKRVVLLDQNLEYVRYLIDEGLDGPYRLFLDEVQNLLYVADNTVDADGVAVSGDVKVFKI